MTVVADDQKTHVLPLALNDLSNAVASSLGLGSIHLTSQPFKTQSPPAGFDGLSFAGSIFLGFTYVIMVMGLAMELIADREIRAKNQLRVNGLDFYIYFGSFYTVFGAMIVILCAALLAMAQVRKKELSKQRWDSLQFTYFF